MARRALPAAGLARQCSTQSKHAKKSQVLTETQDALDWDQERFSVSGEENCPAVLKHHGQ
jgi:hypothetical protein